MLRTCCAVFLLWASATMAMPRMFPSLGLPRDDRPDFCGDLECPPFELLNETDNYEVRSYGAEKWAITNVTGSYYTVAYTKGTSRLLKYFKGANDEGKKIYPTTPTVTAFMLTEDGKGTEKNYTFGYYIPKNLCDNVPKPTNPDVEIASYPATTRFVKIFGGFATEGNLVSQTVALQSQLDKDHQTYMTEMTLGAAYDPPQKLLNRHNEIHIFAGEMTISAE